MRRGALVLLIVLGWGCAKHPGPVATVNGEQIATEEYRGRYKSYIEAMGGRDNILLRKRILDNMINERLMAADVRRRGLDTDAEARASIEDIRIRQMVLAYAQRITLDTMKVSEQELTEEFRRSQTRVKARYLYAATEDSARRLREALDHGQTFEELAKKVFSDPGLAGNGGSLGYFGWGELDSAIERHGYEQPIGAISEPFRFDRGYAILQVEDRVMKPLASELDYAKAKPDLLQAVQKRKVVADLNRATEQLKAELAPVVDSSVAAEAFTFWKSHGGADPAVPLEPSAGEQQLFGKTLLQVKGSPWSVGTFFRKAAVATVKERARIHSPRTLGDFAIGLAVREETMRRAEAAGVAADSAVQDRIARQTLDYFLRRWKQDAEDAARRVALPDSLLRRQYQEKKADYVHPPEVNVAEILLRRKGEADSVARLVRAGRNFAALARSRSLRLWAAQHGGELGYAPQSAYGTLGEKFFAAKPGAIIGPEFVDPYYGVFKIVGRHEAQPMTFEEARTQITEELETPRIQDALKRSLDRLRAAASIVVDDNVLATIAVN